MSRKAKSKFDEERILIFEQDEGLRESLKLILEPKYLLSFASDMREVQSHLPSCKISLFIMDVDRLPDALSILKQIKTTYPELKILLLSVDFELPFQETAVRIGTDIRFQEKPFNPKDFEERIDTLIRGYSLRRHRYIVRIKNKNI